MSDHARATDDRESKFKKENQTGDKKIRMSVERKERNQRGRGDETKNEEINQRKERSKEESKKHRSTERVWLIF